MGICQFMHGRRKQTIQAGRLEKDHERINAASESQFNPAVSLETHNLDALTGLDKGSLTPVDLVHVAKLKLHEGRSPGGHRIDRRGVPHLAL
jgi:hypothetical protein